MFPEFPILSHVEEYSIEEDFLHAFAFFKFEITRLEYTKTRLALGMDAETRLEVPFYRSKRQSRRSNGCKVQILASSNIRC